MHKTSPRSVKKHPDHREGASLARVWWTVGGGLVLALVGGGVFADWWIALPPEAEAKYVGRQSCIECHQPHVEAWTGSHHDLAMDLATESSVLGDFSDQELTHQGITSRMFRRGGKYYVHTEGPDGQLQDFEIKYTFGVEPLQQYMVEFADGRVQVLRISWDTEKKQWFYLSPPDEPDAKLAPDDPLHWTGTGQNWNYMCAECHSTDVHKNYDVASDTYHTTFSEIDVSCESCHGPGSLHIELARQKSLFWDRNHGYGLARLKGKDSKPQIETCAKCHSHRRVVCAGFQPGEPLLDFYEPARIHSGLYHADGQILDEVYVYGSFLQSKMYRKNVRCTDCHDPHTTKLRFEGNKLCAQCHQPGKYDIPAHHHHPVGSKGTLCVECHMPAKTYMEVDPRRDHSLRVPRPDLSVALGVPNACNNCHTKPQESPQWAADKVIEWFGEKRPDDPHYAPALAAAREGKPEGEALLLAALDRDETPSLVKTTALELLAQYDSRASREARSRHLAARDPQLRLSAVRSVSGLAPLELVPLLAPRLTDSIRSVRALAARLLAAAPRRALTPDQEKALDAALVEYVEGEKASADRAGAHMNLGSLYEELGDIEAAAEAYKTAVRLEPYLAGPRTNLAAIYDAGPDAPARLARLRDVKKARELREEELPFLRRDVELLPEDPMPRYRYAMALYLLGRLDDAQKQLVLLCEMAPREQQFRLMLTLLYEKRGDYDAALASLAELAKLGYNPQTVQNLRLKFQAARVRPGTGSRE